MKTGLNKILKRLSPTDLFIKKLDFVKLMTRISEMEPGKSFVEKRFSPGHDFDDQDQITKLAVDLADRAAQEKGDPLSRQELESQANIISCRYDAALHETLKGAAYNIISRLFTSNDVSRLFISRDSRELKHLDFLKQKRNDGQGVIYLINHSSHWDEFIFNTFLDQNGLGLPLFAAGQNMMATPTLTKLFMIGSYVIVRKGAGRAYLSALYHYCQALSEMGKSQGIFLEAWSGGARTRDGSLRYPRRLVALQGALASRNDVLVQPVVISYSRVPEDLGLSEGKGLSSWLNGHHLCREFMKRPWRFWDNVADGLTNIYGRTYVGFGRGRMLSELKEEHAGQNQDLTLDEHVALYAIREIAKDKKIMATQVAARAMASARQNETSDLLSAAQDALAEITDYHQRTFGQPPDFEDIFSEQSLEDVLEDGLRSLRKRKVIASQPLFSQKPPKILAPHGLSYYATHADRRLYSPSAKENLVVCGAGPWGFALVSLVGRRTINDKKYHNSSLTLYDPREAKINTLVYERTLMEYFPDHRLPKNVFPANDHTAAFRKATEVIVATPPNKVDETLKTIFENAGDLKTIIIASRGFDRQSHRLTMQMAWEAAVAHGRTDVNILALSAPFEAGELLSGPGGQWILAGQVTPGRNSEAGLFKFNGFQVHANTDPIGVQVAAALADAYLVYGATLYRQKEFKSPFALAAFALEASAEAKALALALGGQPQTFEADSPAWGAELLIKALNSPASPTIKLAASKGPAALKEYISTRSDLESLWPDTGVTGYYSIHSAYLTAKHLGLNPHHLALAHQMFWE